MSPSLPRIAIDARMVGVRGHGIARYVEALARATRLLRDRGELAWDAVFLVGPGTPVGAGSAFEGLATHLVSAPFLHPREWFALPRALRQVKADLFHSPSFSSLPYCPVPWIQTVHDLNHAQFGSSAQRWYYNVLLRGFASRALRLWTVSEFSRREIAVWLERPETTIAVLLNHVSFEKPVAIRETLAQWDLEPGSYFLCLAPLKPHKNVELLVEAYRRATLRDASLPVRAPLVISAALPEGRLIPGVRAVGALTESQVRALLAGCRAAVSPSLYEGFGMPPVEAVLAGVPVAVSDIPPHREGLQGVTTAVWSPANSLARWTDILSGKVALPAPLASEQVLLRERYGLESFAQRMRELYLDALSLLS